MTAPDRRRYPRAQTQVIYRRSGPAWIHHRRSTVDVSAGGVRALSDEAFEIGARLDLELLMDDGAWLPCWVRVVWVDEFPAKAPARYEVGMQFVDIAAEDQRRLASVLDRQA